MKTSQALRLTLAQLWDGNYPQQGCRHICFAARGIGVGHIVEPIILKLLKGHGTLAFWIEAQGISNVFYDLLKIQATRKAWLLHLIAHYESLGD